MGNSETQGPRRDRAERVVWAGREGDPLGFPQTIKARLTQSSLCVSHVWVTGRSVSRWKEACGSHVQEKPQLQAGGAGLATGLSVEMLRRKDRTFCVAEGISPPASCWVVL